MCYDAFVTAPYLTVVESQMLLRYGTGGFVQQCYCYSATANIAIIMLRQRSLAYKVKTGYLSFARPDLERWRVNADGSRRKWRDTSCILPGDAAVTHTLHGHDNYLAAMIDRGAAIRELVLDGFHFQLVHRAMAGREAADSLQRWFNRTWDLLLDLTAHRQRLRSYHDPDAVPQFTWEQHKTVWLLFRWELIVPDDAAVAAAVRGHLRLYAFPRFEWLTGTPYQEINRCLASRQKIPLARPRETILVDTGGPGDQFAPVNRGPMRSLVDFMRDQEQAAAAAAAEAATAAAVAAATTAAAERVVLQQRDAEPPQVPVRYLRPAGAPTGAETDSTPPTSAHQLWTPPVVQAGAGFQYPPPPVAPPAAYAPTPAADTAVAPPGSSDWHTATSWTGWQGAPYQHRPLPPPPALQPQPGNYYAPLDQTYNSSATPSASSHSYTELRPYQQDQHHAQQGQQQYQPSSHNLATPSQAKQTRSGPPEDEPTDSGCGLGIISGVRSLRGRGGRKKTKAGEGGGGQQRRRRRDAPEATMTSGQLQEQLQSAPTGPPPPLRQRPMSSFLHPSMYVPGGGGNESDDDPNRLVIDEGQDGGKDNHSVLIIICW